MSDAPIIGSACGPADCQCQTNPLISCQFVETKNEWVPAKILNARKGDLIMCPGDGSGSIGMLLGALVAPQVYTHMGVMVEDYTTIRHATMITNRMQAYPDGSIAGTPVPLRGFEPDKVKIGWPGTMTQTVDEIYQAQNQSSIEHDPNIPPPYLYCDRDNGSKVFLQEDSDNFCFESSELSFNDTFGADGVRRPALVVSPCKALERQFPLLREIAHSIADEVKGVNGHYRFFAYTDASIAKQAQFRSDGPMPLFRWVPSPMDPREGKWTPTEISAFDPASPCASPNQTQPVKFTVPVVCSSLPWLAVQKFNARQNQYTVILDPSERGKLIPSPAACARIVQPNPAGAVFDPESQTLDGLYFFTERDRASAAARFNQGLQNDVLAAVAARWDKLSGAISAVTGSPVAPLAEIAVVIAAGTAVGWAVAELATLLNISIDAATDLIVFFTSMPKAVANQMVNTFAFDDANDHDSTRWKRPGVGRAVGPDDIIWFWTGTTTITRIANHTEVQGLYGENRNLILAQAGWGTVADCRWTLSQGFGALTARVQLNTTPHQSVANALVALSCREALTNVDGICNFSIPNGVYWASASWQDPETGDFWSVQQKVEVLAGQDTNCLFLLAPPSVDFRTLNCAVSGEASEGSIWAQGSFPQVVLPLTILLGPRGNPADPNTRLDGLTGKQGNSQNYAEDKTVNVEVDATLEHQGFVSGRVIISLKKTDEILISNTADFGPIAPGDAWEVDVQLTGPGLTPDQADLTVKIFNDQGYGPPQGA